MLLAISRGPRETAGALRRGIKDAAAKRVINGAPSLQCEVIFTFSLRSLVSRAASPRKVTTALHWERYLSGSAAVVHYVMAENGTTPLARRRGVTIKRYSLNKHQQAQRAIFFWASSRSSRVKRRHWSINKALLMGSALLMWHTGRSPKSHWYSHMRFRGKWAHWGGGVLPLNGGWRDKHWCEDGSLQNESCDV